MPAVASPAMHRMQHAVTTLLHCIGEDPTREGLRDTPKVGAGGGVGALLGGDGACAASVQEREEFSCSYVLIYVSEQRVAKAWLDMTRGEDQNHTE